MMQVFNAPPELKPLLKELKDMGDWRKKADAREAEIWVTLEKYIKSVVGDPYIDDDEEKHGEVVFVLDGIEFGRTVSNYGSKIEPEELDKALTRLLKEGVIEQEEYDSIIEKTETVTYDYRVDENELKVLATSNPDVLAAVNRAKSPPEPRPSRIKPRAAKAENISAARYFESKVETGGDE